VDTQAVLWRSLAHEKIPRVRLMHTCEDCCERYAQLRKRPLSEFSRTWISSATLTILNSTRNTRGVRLGNSPLPRNQTSLKSRYGTGPYVPAVCHQTCGPWLAGFPVPDRLSHGADRSGPPHSMRMHMRMIGSPESSISYELFF